MATKKSKAEPRVLSEEELIEQALNDVYHFSNHYTPKEITLHPIYDFQIGQKVEIGNLKDCTIIAKSDKFPGAYAVRYSRVDNNYGNPIRSDNLVGGWAWNEISPVVQTRKKIKENGFKNLFSRLRTRNSSLSSIVTQYLEGALIDDMAYQRDYVWTLEDKRNLIRSIVEQKPIGAFIIGQAESLKPDQLIDGKQRLNALVEFLAGQYAVDDVFYHEMCFSQQYSIDSYNAVFYDVNLSEVSKADLLQIFLMLNDGGVAQTSEHLNKVRAMLQEEQSQKAN